MQPWSLESTRDFIKNVKKHNVSKLLTSVQFSVQFRYETHTHTCIQYILYTCVCVCFIPELFALLFGLL